MNALEFVDKWLGKAYMGMKKVIADSGDFIQGFKKMLVKELDAVIQLMFNLGMKLCLVFIALDVALYLIDKPINKISIFSKILALIGIMFFKYNVINHLKKLPLKNKSEN